MVACLYRCGPAPAGSVYGPARVYGVAGIVIPSPARPDDLDRGVRISHPDGRAGNARPRRPSAHCLRRRATETKRRLIRFSADIPTNPAAAGFVVYQSGPAV